MIKKKISIIILLFIGMLLFGQVGINTSEPNNNALLHISEKFKSTDPSSDNKLKGIIIPRLTEIERDKLTYVDPLADPKVFNLSTVDNGLMIFNTSENCFNFWEASELEWKSICGNLGNATFIYDCTKIAVNGNYVIGKEVDGTHFITIKDLNVTKAGAYVITASATPENGYSYIAQGTFTTTGNQTVRLYAQGTPTTAKTDNFTLESSGSDTQSVCNVPVIVEPGIATYTINCARVIVNGSYSKNTDLTSSNTIVVSLNVATVGSYNIMTTDTNGISFSKSGKFTNTGITNVILDGIGAPTVNSDFEITITTNTTSGNNICVATIPVILPAMTYAVIGDSHYSWESGHARGNSINVTNFSETGRVKIKSLTRLWQTSNITTAFTNLRDLAKPDVILFFAYGTPNLDVNLSQSLTTYVNNGGVLIYGSKDNDFADVNTLLSGMFGANFNSVGEKQIDHSSSSPPGNSQDDNVYPINNIPDDPIINGPFGNANGKYWGEDNGSTGSIIVKQLPPNSVQIASANNQFSKYTVDPEYSMVWYNKTKKIVYFGDSVGSSNSSTSLLEYPSRFSPSPTYIPMVKRYGQWPNENLQAQFVYNSTLELNALAWALKMAAIEGINPH